MAYPRDAQDAREHIQQIREDKGLGGSKDNVADLEVALSLLSEQLYQKPTHFLLELVQNADDNIYNHKSPTLEIRYKDRRLLVSCNEVGFSRKNVDAICRIGRSTKTHQYHSTGYIGEKGIGFKSVFKVADVVWIKSGCYSFKFDRSEILGMIAPIWADFPDPGLARPGHTSILLQLSEGYDEEGIIQEIEAFDPRLLVFLQKLKHLDITITRPSGQESSTVIARQDRGGRVDDVHYVTLQRNNDFQRYMVVRHPVRDLATDPKRPGYVESELLLGFPVTSDGYPVVKSQFVHAFLPIRDYGLKYLIQGDFLLLASREDIDNSSAWNKALLRAIPSAMVGAIQQFNKQDILRYTWLEFLDMRPPYPDFFASLESSIDSVLSQQRILETVSGDWARPTDLYLVPPRFLNSQGKPLLMCDSFRGKYLSLSYSANDWEVLKRLGVQQQTAKEFLEDLDYLLRHHTDDFRSRPDDWHSSLSHALSSILGAENLQNQGKIARMELVPLRDGTWRSAHGNKLFFANESARLTVPPGVKVLEVHPKASRDSRRHQFLRQLGVVPFNALQIGAVISDTHSNPSFRPANVPRAHLVLHARYLYNAGWTNASRRSLWFASNDGTFAPGCRLYIKSSENFAAATWPKAFTEELCFLHEDYFSWLGGDDAATEEWIQWLVSAYEVNVFPLMATAGPGESFSLSDDFRTLLSVSESSEVLELLRSKWDYYAPWIERAHALDKDEDWEMSRMKLVSELGAMEVKCTCGTPAALNRTVLPVSGLPAKSSLQLLLLDVKFPNAPSWHFLQHLGVSIKMDPRIFVDQLRAVRDTSMPIHEVSKMYVDLELHGPPPEELRKIFARERLIFIPPVSKESPGIWLTSGRCVWDGHQVLRRTAPLNRTYPYLRNFFQGILHIGDADITTLVHEVTTINEGFMIKPAEALDYIAELLTAISENLQRVSTPRDAACIQRLATGRIFPVKYKGSREIFDSLMTTSQKEMWLIADRPHLRQSFEGRVNLLVFNTKQIADMSELFCHLKLGYRMLSTVATGLAQVSGKARLQGNYTELLRSKAPLITSLAPVHSTMKKDVLHATLRSVDVFEADRVVVEWSVRAKDGTKFQGRADSGRVKLTYENSKLSIYLTKGDIVAPVPPLELVEELLKFCGIHDVTQTPILQQILMTANMASSVEMLERRGITVDYFHAKRAVPAKSQDTNANNSLLQFESSSAGASAGDLVLDPGSTASEDLQKDDKKKADELEKFIRGLDRAGSVEAEMNREWGKRQTKPLLSRVCRLDGQNAALFLPTADVIGAQERGRGLPDEETEWSFERWDKPDSDWKTRHKGTDLMFEALYLPYGKGGSKVYIFNRNVKNVTEEVAFLGELTFSRLLEVNLGSAYLGQRDWTSVLRTRAGHPPFESEGESTSTFTITDTTGDLATFLSNPGYRKSPHRKNNTIFHIEVITTEGTLEDSKFYMRGDQIAKAQKCSQDASSSSPSEIFVLVRISDVKMDPKIAIFVDPWRLVANGQLSATNLAHYHLSFVKGVPEHVELNENMLQPKSWGSRIDKKLNNLLDRSGKQQIAMMSSTSISSMMYQYKKLKGFRDFRLFELLPGGEADPLEGAIKETSLESSEKYAALSYQWGSDLKPYHIRTSRGLVPITESLHGALRQLRDTDKSITLWVDAICINQDNSHEKIVQIRLMSDIYQSAESVKAWIGEDAPGSNEAIETLLQIRTLALNPPLWPKILPKVPESWRSRKCPHESDPIWVHIDELFERGWFSRVWILQEIIFATKVSLYCGSWCIDWDDIFEALKICIKENSRYLEERLPKPGRQIPIAAHAIGITRQVYRDPRWPKKHSFLKLLELFSYTSATREEDKLFALLLLASDVSGREFDPDYISPFEKVVRRYANAFVADGKALELLYRAGGSKSFDFCSWIPHWTRKDHPKTISTWYSNGSTFAAADKTQLRAFVHPKDKQVLVVGGIYVDKIATVGDVTLRDSDAVAYLNSLRKEINSFVTYPTGESVHDLKLRLPMGNASRPHLDALTDAMSTYRIMATKAHSPGRNQGVNERAEARGIDLSGATIDIKSIRHLVDFVKQPGDLRQSLWNYLQTVAAFSKRLSIAKFCTTERGYAGLVPQLAEIGDTIVIVHGAVVPFLIREHDLKGGVMRNKLIGECYIHGIMHGEALSFPGVKESDIHFV